MTMYFVLIVTILLVHLFIILFNRTQLKVILFYFDKFVKVILLFNEIMTTVETFIIAYHLIFSNQSYHKMKLYEIKTFVKVLEEKKCESVSDFISNENIVLILRNRLYFVF